MSAPAATSLTKLRNAFLSGLLMLAPLAVTWLVFRWLVDKVGGAFRPVFFFFVPAEWLGLGRLSLVWDILATVIVVCLITLLGLLSRYVLGRFFGQIMERAISGIPGVNTVYNTVKQIIGTFTAQNRNLFEKVVLVEFPRKGAWVIGFLTNKAQGEAQARTAEEVWTVFIPTTPNPTSGFLVMLPRREIVELDMSVGDGMKLIISGGAVVPPWSSVPAESAAAGTAGPSAPL